MLEQKPVKREIQPRSDKSLDKEWYERFERIGSFQAYEYLDGDKGAREQEQKRFTNGEIKNPSLDYPLLSERSLKIKEKALLFLKQDILDKEPNAVVRQAYRWRINEKIAEARMLLATARGDMNAFQRYSEFIYGKPDKRIFEYTVHKIREEIADEVKQANNPELDSIANDFFSKLPKGSDTIPRFLPTSEAFEQSSDKTKKEFYSLLSIPVTGKELEEILDAQSIKTWLSPELCAPIRR